VKVDTKIYASEFSAIELEQGAGWSSFVGSNSAMLELGFRPAQVDAAVELTRDLEIVDHSLYISDDDANYRTEILTHVFTSVASERVFEGWEPVALGARPTSIQTFAGDGYLGYSAAWVYDSEQTTPAVPWLMKVGQTKQEVESLLANPGFRAIALSSRRRNGVSEYALVLVSTDSPQGWSADIDVPTSQLGSLIHNRWEDGFYPFRITTEDRRSTRVNVLWMLRPPGISVQARVNFGERVDENCIRIEVADGGGGHSRIGHPRDDD
jgi:hypothetical protein